MSGKVLTVDNPYSGEIVFEKSLHDEAAIGFLLDRAQQAFEEWRGTDLSARQELVERFVAVFLERREAYALEITQCMGKPLPQALGEVDAMCDRVRQMSSISEEALSPYRLPEKKGFERFIAREPVGVVYVLAAWNYPLLTAINPIIAALLSGNVVVLKHSSRTPRVAEQIVEVFQAAGAPPGLIQFVHTDHAHAERIAQDSRVGFVSFTGSVTGGRRIYQAVAGKRFIDVALELGGKDPAYVAGDCPLDHTVECLVDAAFYNAGQSCCGVERVYVHADLYGAFVEALVEKVRTFVPGDPVRKETVLGPMAQENAADFLVDQVAQAQSQGARVLLGGAKATHEGQGRFFMPAVVADTTHQMSIATEESFGPVVAIASVKDDDEAIRRMNHSAFGLTASVWTQDRDRAFDLLKQIEAGTVFMNRADYLDPLLAWTGWKDSGKGVSLSRFGFHSVTRPKSYHLRTHI